MQFLQERPRLNQRRVHGDETEYFQTFSIVDPRRDSYGNVIASLCISKCVHIHRLLPENALSPLRREHAGFYVELPRFGYSSHFLFQMNRKLNILRNLLCLFILCYNGKIFCHPELKVSYMSFCRPISFIAIIAILISAHSSAQWIHINGPEGGSISCLTKGYSEDSSLVLMAGTSSLGVYRSTDRGHSWRECNNGILSMNITALCAAPDGNGGSLLYAGFNGDGVSRSSDYGITWKNARSGFPVSPVRCFTFCTNQTGTGYLFSGTDAGVFSSSDNGGTWNKKNTGLESHTVLCLAARKNDDGESDLFAGTSSGKIFRSSDYGTNWTQMYSHPQSEAVLSLAIHPDGTLYAGFNNSMYRTTDDGASWTQIADDHLNRDFIWIEFLPDGHGGYSIYTAGMFLGLSRSKDNGLSWEEFNDGVDCRYLSSLISFTDENEGNVLLAGSSGGGIYRRVETDASWKTANTGFGAASVKQLCESPDGSELFAATDWNGVFRSEGKGASWRAANSGLPMQYTFALGHNNSSMFAANLLEGMYRSSDMGASWHSSGTGLPSGAVSDIVTLQLSPNPSFLFVRTSQGVYRSSDNGASWSGANSGLPGSVCKALHVHPSATGGAVVLVSTIDEVYRSTDAGSTWVASGNGLPSTSPDEFVSGRRSTSDWSLFASVEKGVYRSQDDGIHWQRMDTGLGASTVTHLASYNKTAGIVFAGTQECRVYYTVNDGEEWKALPGLLPSENTLTAMTVLGDTLFAGCDKAGIWKYSIARFATGIEDGCESSLPVLEIDEVYPNPVPAGHSVEFKYTVSQPGRLVLSVYNALGMHLADVEDEPLNAGSCGSRLQTGSLQPGIYLYKVEFNGVYRTGSFIVRP